MKYKYIISLIVIFILTIKVTFSQQKYTVTNLTDLLSITKNAKFGDTIFIPDGYILGRLDHQTGKMWYNNGATQIKVYPDSEPSGYIRGMLPRKSKI